MELLKTDIYDSLKTENIDVILKKNINKTKQIKIRLYPET